MIYEATEDFVKDLISKGSNFSIVPDKFEDNDLTATVTYFVGTDKEVIQVSIYCDIQISDDIGNTYYFEDGKFLSHDGDEVYSGTDLRTELIWVNLFDFTKVITDKQYHELYEHIDSLASEWVSDTLHGKGT